MKQITVRGLDPRAEEQIRKRAKEKGKSLNQVVLDIIHRSVLSFGMPKSCCT